MIEDCHSHLCAFRVAVCDDSSLSTCISLGSLEKQKTNRIFLLLYIELIRVPYRFWSNCSNNGCLL